MIFFEGTPTKSLDGKGDDRVAAAMASMSDQPSYKRSRLPKMCVDISEMCNNVMSIDTCKGVGKPEMLYGDFSDDGHDLSYFANTSAIAATLSVTFRDGYDGAYTIYYPYSGNIVNGEGNKVILNVPAYEAVIVMREDDNTADTPVIGEDVTTDGTEPSTDEPTPETTVEGAVTESLTDTEKGCSSALSASAALGVAVAAAAVLKKKKEDD